MDLLPSPLYLCGPRIALCLTFVAVLFLSACGNGTVPAGERASLPEDSSLADTSGAGAEASAPPQPPDYSEVLPALRRQTELTVLLPTSIPFSGEAVPVYGHLEEVTDSTYSVALDAIPGCLGASACNIGRVRARAAPSAGGPPEGTPVSLMEDVTGYFAEADPVTCGAGYCYDSMTWELGGVCYVLELKSAGEDSVQRLQRAVSSAIEARGTR